MEGQRKSFPGGCPAQKGFASDLAQINFLTPDVFATQQHGAHMAKLFMDTRVFLEIIYKICSALFGTLTFNFPALSLPLRLVVDAVAYPLLAPETPCHERRGVPHSKPPGMVI